jgi:hypothetical protein
MSSNADKLQALHSQLSQIIYDVGEIQRKLSGIIASIQLQTTLQREENEEIPEDIIDGTSSFQPSF